MGCLPTWAINCCLRGSMPPIWRNIRKNPPIEGEFFRRTVEDAGPYNGWVIIVKERPAAESGRPEIFTLLNYSRVEKCLMVRTI